MNETEMIQLVTLAQAGDRDAFGKLAEQFEQTVFATVFRRLRNHAEAAEVTQDVFIQAMRKLSQLREPARFAGWLKRIAVRMSINRAVRRPNETARSPEMFGSLTDRTDTPLADLMRSENAAEVRGGMAKLRELDRQTLIAFYFEGQSLKQMSDQFDSPIGTIKRRLHTARNRLKEMLVEMQSA